MTREAEFPLQGRSALPPEARSSAGGKGNGFTAFFFSLILFWSVVHGGSVVPGFHGLPFVPLPIPKRILTIRSGHPECLGEGLGSFSEPVSLRYTGEHGNSCSIHALRMDGSILLPNNRRE